MDKIFVSILNMSIASCIVIAAVLLIRLIFRKAPKAFFCVLWAFVGLRLICPLTLHSPISLVPDTQPIIDDAFSQETVSVKTVTPDNNDGTEETLEPENNERSALSVQSGTGIIRNNTEDQKHDEQTERDAPAKSETTEPEAPSDETTDTQSENESNRFILMLPYIWIAGTALMFVFALVRYFLLSRKLKDTKADEKGIYYSKKVTTPFIIGIISPKIYLPDGTTESDKEYILAHEFAHLHRLDHLWKPIGFAILCLHWFNPLVWLAFHFFCKDIELACDERVVSEYSLEKRKEYSYALVNCSSQKKAFNYLPLGFGESSVKERVVNVLSYKKPAFWVIIICVFAAAGISVFLMTNPISSNSAGKSEENENIPVLNVQDDNNLEYEDYSEDEDLPGKNNWYDYNDEFDEALWLENNEKGFDVSEDKDYTKLKNRYPFFNDWFIEMIADMCSSGQRISYPYQEALNANLISENEPRLTLKDVQNISEKANTREITTAEGIQEILNIQPYPDEFRINAANNGIDTYFYLNGKDDMIILCSMGSSCLRVKKNKVQVLFAPPIKFSEINNPLAESKYLKAINSPKYPRVELEQSDVSNENKPESSEPKSDNYRVQDSVDHLLTNHP